MKRRNEKREKQARNALYAAKFRRPDREKNKRHKWAAWCRTPGHSASCDVRTCQGVRIP